MSDGTWHLPVAIGDDWEGRHHDHSTEVDPSWAVAQLVARNHNLTAILTDLIAELRSRNHVRVSGHGRPRGSPTAGGRR